MTRSKHHTAWAGALAVASELSRRGYDAAITLGNTPKLDLVCSSPDGRSFGIQVKSTSSPNWIFVNKSLLESEPRIGLLVVVVLVPPALDRDCEFFVLTHNEAVAAYGAQRRTKMDGQPYKQGNEGLAWSAIKPHRGRWDKLPS